MTGYDERERNASGGPRPHTYCTGAVNTESVKGSYLQISVNNKPTVHVFQPQDDFGGVEPHLLLREHPVL